MGWRCIVVGADLSLYPKCLQSCRLHHFPQSVFVHRIVLCPSLAAPFSIFWSIHTLSLCQLLIQSKLKFPDLVISTTAKVYHQPPGLSSYSTNCRFKQPQMNQRGEETVTSCVGRKCFHGKYKDPIYLFFYIQADPRPWTLPLSPQIHDWKNVYYFLIIFMIYDVYAAFITYFFSVRVGPNVGCSMKSKHLHFGICPESWIKTWFW